jgi:hypothetical protein
MKKRNDLAKRRVFRLAGRLVVAMATLIAGGAAWGVVPAHCVALDVPAPFVMPDDSVHPAGELRMCLSQNFNPVSGLHRVYIDGIPRGFLLSHIANAEIPKDVTPSALFYGESGRLRLVGYTVAANGKVFSYRLWNGRAASGAAMAANSGGADEALPEPESRILLAARLE